MPKNHVFVFDVVLSIDPDLDTIGLFTLVGEFEAHSVQWTLQTHESLSSLVTQLP
jgi:hypothetical protein